MRCISVEQSGTSHEIIEKHSSLWLACASRSSMGSLERNMNMCQSLLLELKSVVPDRKVHRSGELKKGIASVIGVSPDDSLTVAHRMKPLTSLSVEEYKQFRANLHEDSIRARDRAKEFGDAASKIDKYYQSILPRERSPPDTSLTGLSNQLFQKGSTSKTVSHLSAAEFERSSQKTEEKAKNVASNRCIRTSMEEVKMDVQVNGTVRSSRLVNRDKKSFRLEDGNAELCEENGKALPTGVDGWEKSKSKKKRSRIKSDASASAILSQPLDGDGELNYNPRHGHDARPRLNSSEVDRLNALEANTAPNAGSVTKMNVSSGDSRVSSALLKASSNIYGLIGSPEKLEVPQSQIKKDNFVKTNNCKHLEPKCSSPPVGQWGWQLLQKMSIVSRSNLHLVSSNDEVQTADLVDNAAVVDEGVGYPKQLPSNASQRSKVKGNHVSFTGSSESGGSRVAENKPRDRDKKQYEMPEKTGQDIQVAALVLPLSKDKVSAGKDLGDSFHRRRRTARSFGLKRSARATSVGVGKHKSTANERQLRSAILGSEIIESKAEDLPSRSYECLHLRRAVNTLAEESVDGHDELLAAANSALKSGHNCSGPSDSVRKRMGWVLDSISAEDASYLKQQIKCLHESSADACFPANHNHNSKDVVNDCSIPSTPAVACGDYCSGITTKTGLNVRGRDLGIVGQTKHVDPSIEELVHGTGSRNGISMYEALLSAIIDEEDIRKVNYSASRGEDCLNTGVYVLDAETDTLNLNMASLENSQTVERASSNGYRVKAIWSYHDEMKHSKLESDGRRVESKIETNSNVFNRQEVPSNTSCSGCEYDQLCIDDRILVELKEIGLLPESMPDLTQSEDDEILEDITKLEKMLHQQATWGPNDTGGKNVNKSRKHAVLAFVKHTLARCREYEKTGRSPFIEPEFRDFFLCLSSCRNRTDCVDNSDGHTCLTIQPRQKLVALDKHSSSASRSDTCLPDRTSDNNDHREVVLDDVVDNTVNSLRGPIFLGSILVNGAKRKRSLRSRDRKGCNREATSGNGTARIGQPTISNIKGEKKNKPKRKRKTTQLSASLNGPFGKPSNLPITMLPSTLTSHEMSADGNVKEKDELGLPSSGIQHVSNDSEVLANFQLPDIDDLCVTNDLSSQVHDITSWLSIGDDGLQDNDFMGLQIPMDDLSELRIF